MGERVVVGRDGGGERDLGEPSVGADGVAGHAVALLVRGVEHSQRGVEPEVPRA